MTASTFKTFMGEFPQVAWGELQGEASAILETFKKILADARALFESGKQLQQQIRIYQEKRLMLIYKKLREQNLDWCSCGKHTASKRGLSLFLVRRVEGEYDYMSGGDYEEVTRIFKTCPGCRKKIKQTFNFKPSTYRQVCPAKKTKIGFLIYDGSTWQEKDMEGVKVNITMAMDGYDAEKLAKAYDIAPLIACYGEKFALLYPHLNK